MPGDTSNPLPRWRRQRLTGISRCPGGYSVMQGMTSSSPPSRQVPSARTPGCWTGCCSGSGRSVLASRHTTCLPKYMERVAYLTTAWRLGRYYRTYPAYVEDEVRAALADPGRQFERGPVTLTAREPRPTTRRPSSCRTATTCPRAGQATPTCSAAVSRPPAIRARARSLTSFRDLRDCPFHGAGVVYPVISTISASVAGARAAVTGRSGLPVLLRPREQQGDG
jgi:hypothetical protein